MTTVGPSISSTVFRTKRGERFTVALSLPVRETGDWVGVVGYGQIRTSADVLLHDFGTVNGAIAGDDSATITFDATAADTVNWVCGNYWVDFSFKIGSTYGPRMTQTYKLVVSDGPTNLP